MYNPLLNHKEKITKFWNNFEGFKFDGRGYSPEIKLALLQELATERIYYKNGQSLTTRRTKFDKIKRHRHNRLQHKFCFICLGEANVRHHIIQLQHGGINSKRNIISLCYKCHADIHPWLKKS